MLTSVVLDLTHEGPANEAKARRFFWHHLSSIDRGDLQTQASLATAHLGLSAKAGFTLFTLHEADAGLRPRAS